MIKIIIGKKGSGKTKLLAEMVNAAADTSLGNVVCIEKSDALIYSIKYKARLVDTDTYSINGYDEYYGMIAGIKAGNHDITHIFGDATLRIGGRDFDKLAEFFERIAKINDVEFIFTISADKEELPKKIFDIAEVCN